ncbi:MAG TPA: hypothetical protein VJB65_01140 [Patescibacteria group bacterium]|nr:hypothetical protein [Patescibacteria group bacterium]
MPIDSQKVHQHLQSIARINTALAIISLCAVFGLYIWLRWFVAPSVNTTVQNSAPQPEAINAARVQSIEELTKEYQAQVLTAVGSFQFDESQEAERILNTIVELRVPAEFKSFHVQLVITLNDAKNKKYAEAQKRMQAMREQFSWFRSL